MGKSLLTLQWAVALALGDGTFPGLPVKERVRVIVVNLEDDGDELRLRLAAIMRYFDLSFTVLDGWLHFYDARREGFTAIRRTGSRALTEGTNVQGLINCALELEAGAIFVDPLVETHEASENDSAEMKQVMVAFRRIAEETRAAVTLVHYTAKPKQAASDGFAGNMNAGRGASAIVNAARVALTLMPMTSEDKHAKAVPSEQRHLYVVSMTRRPICIWHHRVRTGSKRNPSDCRTVKV